ncbi:MAG: X-Pro dipeptidyl-peptidase, partial [Maribacter sp.]
FTLLLVSHFLTYGQSTSSAKPVFKDGEAQIVSAFEDNNKWIRHDL